MTDRPEVQVELEEFKLEGDVYALRFKTLRQHFATYVLESHPFALEPAVEAFDVAQETVSEKLPDDGLVDRVALVEALRLPFRQALTSRIDPDQVKYLDEPTPRVGPGMRLGQEIARLIDDCDGFLRRESLAASLVANERRELLAGMVLTRAVDTRLKQFFSGGEVRFGGKSFQGKGFRSLGQEAIYGACLRLRRGDDYRTGGVWTGDVVAPLIRDGGAALAMHPGPEMVRNILSAQMGKAGPPMDGRDLHIGDLSRGVLPPAAPLSISSLNVAGIAFAMSQEPAARDGDSRVAVALIGEGGAFAMVSLRLGRGPVVRAAVWQARPLRKSPLAAPATLVSGEGYTIFDRACPIWIRPQH